MKKLFILALIFFAFSFILWTWRLSAASVVSPWSGNNVMMRGYGMHDAMGWVDTSTRNEQEYLRIYQWVDEDTQALADQYLANLITSTNWDSLTSSEVQSILQDYYGETVDYLIELLEGAD